MESTGQLFHIKSRRQVLRRGPTGNSEWGVINDEEHIDPGDAALVVCDVWDDHWCRISAKRLEQLVPRMSEVVVTARNRGMLVIHAPSETMDYYAGSPARRRAIESPMVEIPRDIDHLDPPLPIDDSDGGCDAEDNPYPPHTRRWTRQHDGIPIDERKDAITDKGEEVYRLLRVQGRTHLFIMGVHTNMCILNRSFGIKQMVRWGLEVRLIRDLTDSGYSPSSSPYVSHDEGTNLVVGYIEKFWCPTVMSDSLFR